MLYPHYIPIKVTIDPTKSPWNPVKIAVPGAAGLQLPWLAQRGMARQEPLERRRGARAVEPPNEP